MKFYWVWGIGWGQWGTGTFTGESFFAEDVFQDWQRFKKVNYCKNIKRQQQTQAAWVFFWLATLGFLGEVCATLTTSSPSAEAHLSTLLDQLWIGSEWPRLATRTAVTIGAPWCSQVTSDVPGSRVDRRSSYWGQQAVFRHSGRVLLGLWVTWWGRPGWSDQKQKKGQFDVGGRDEVCLWSSDATNSAYNHTERGSCQSHYGHDGYLSLNCVPFCVGSAVAFASFSVYVWPDQPEFGEIQRHRRAPNLNLGIMRIMWSVHVSSK